MSPMEQFKENMAMQMFGRSRILAIAGNSCVKCGQGATKFSDELSRKEFGISGFCQTCQDEVFATDSNQV